MIDPTAKIYEGVTLGAGCHVEAFAFIPPGVTLGDDVFIGPHVCFTNDRYPRSYKHCPTTPTNVRRGASIGAHSTILCGLTIGEDAIVGMGAVVTRDVPPRTVVVGNPARIIRRLSDAEIRHGRV